MKDYFYLCSGNQIINKDLRIMKKLTRLLMMMAVLTISACLMSCGETIVIGNTDKPAPKPTPTPTPTPTPENYSNLTQPLTFQAAVENVTVMFKITGTRIDYKSVEYSFDGETWTPLSSNEQPILLKNVGDEVMFRGNNDTYNGEAQFVIEQSAASARAMTRTWDREIEARAYGNLLFMTDPITGKILTGANAGAFKNILQGCHIDCATGDGKALVVQVETMPEGFLEGAFQDCTAMVTTPVVSSQTISKRSLVNAFNDCTNLETATILVETVVEGATVEECMGGMLANTGEVNIVVTEGVATGNVTATDVEATINTTLTVADIVNASGADAKNVTVSYLNDMQADATISGRGAEGSSPGKDDAGSSSGKDAGGSSSGGYSRPGKTVVFAEYATVSPTSLGLEVGDTCKLAATVYPAEATNKTVKWTTSDPAVATVANGVVTAVAPGMAIIKAEPNGAGGFGGGSEGSITKNTCTVTVVAKTVPVTGVTLNKTTLPLTEGTTETLTATVAPSDASNQNVTWTTDNAAVATVDTDGKVTAVKAGTATITVTTADGSKTATCTVTVTAKTVAVTGVTLNKTELPLTEGTTETLTATVAPSDATNKNVTWTTSDAAVATVDTDGKVTAVKAGTATITVTTADGGLIATCTVTVEAKTVAVTGVSLNKTELDLFIGGSETLTATVAPTDATNKTVTWKSSKESVAKVDANGKVTAVGAGEATITVTTTDGSLTATCKVTVKTPAINPRDSFGDGGDPLK